jgi:hypothetical protein
MVEGSRRTLLGARASGEHGGRRGLLRTPLPSLTSARDATALSGDGTRVACLAIKDGGDDACTVELSIFDGDGKLVWASVPRSLAAHGIARGVARLFLSDDGRAILVQLGETLLAFSEPRLAAIP